MQEDEGMKCEAVLRLCCVTQRRIGQAADGMEMEMEMESRSGKVRLLSNRIRPGGDTGGNTDGRIVEAREWSLIYTCSSLIMVLIRSSNRNSSGVGMLHYESLSSQHCVSVAS